MMYENIVIGEVECNANEVIRVTRVTPSKSKLESIDIRRFRKGKDGEFGPTYKGIQINSETMPEVMKILVAALSPEEKIDILALMSDI